MTFHTAVTSLDCTICVPEGMNPYISGVPANVNIPGGGPLSAKTLSTLESVDSGSCPLMTTLVCVSSNWLFHHFRANP